MNSSKFDELTKALATATSRRQALKTFGATFIGGILALGGVSTAFAKCKPNGHPCGNDKQCCGGGCCNGTCTDLKNDVNNCGVCGNTCPSGDSCVNGSCCNPVTGGAGCGKG